MTAASTAVLSCLVVLVGCDRVKEAADAAATDPAEIFCFTYDDACGFGSSPGDQPYASFDDCVSSFEDYNQVRRSCAQEHVTFAAEGDPATNCTGAEGGAPCDPDSTFCAQYDLICGFANDFGGTPYTDADDCQSRYDGFLATRQMCVQQHLGFAEQDPNLHCPHVAGAAPCD